MKKIKMIMTKEIVGTLKTTSKDIEIQLYNMLQLERLLQEIAEKDLAEYEPKRYRLFSVWNDIFPFFKYTFYFVHYLTEEKSLSDCCRIEYSFVLN